MSNLNICTIKDIPELAALINSAYRGEQSRLGWTTEAHIIKGEKRTDIENLAKLIQTNGSVFLKVLSKDGNIKGCVFLQKKETRIYLGMLSVNPAMQAKGTGRQLLEYAEIYARENCATSIYMTVISVRHELIEWYERRGYKKTGEKQPFPAEDSFGIPTQPLEMIVLEKIL